MFQMKSAKERLQDIESKYNSLVDQCATLDKRCELASKELAELRSQIDTANGVITLIDRGEEYTPELANSTTCEKRITQLQEQLGKLLYNNHCVSLTRTYRIDGSTTKGAKFQKEQCSNLIYGLSAYIDNKIKAVTADNFTRQKELIQSAYAKYNKKADLFGAHIDTAYLTVKLGLLRTKLDYKLAKEAEHKRILEEKRRIKEQEALLAEAEKERKRLEMEKKAMDVAYGKALTDQEREEIQANISKIDKRLADIAYKCSHSQSGWVYLITSPSLPGMYKCGVTRQLTPAIRVNQLSSSSLPFPFVLNAYCFADDAFEIETKMHHYFDNKRVNKDREFFYGNVEEAIAVLESVFKQEVHKGIYEEEENDL